MCELRAPYANAIVFPLSRRLAFTDGLLAALDDDEVTGVCAHELAHLRRGESSPARIWFDIARRWHHRADPGNPELIRFRAEAASLLGMSPEADRNQRHTKGTPAEPPRGYHSFR